MQRVEGGVEPDLGDVARARQADLPLADDARGRAGAHDDDAVGERDGFLEVVGDEHHRLAVGAPQLQQEIAHDLPGLRVERAEGLVHQQDARVADQHLGEADALALAAREHVRVAPGEGGKADAGKPAPRLLLRFGRGRAGDLQPDGDVLQRRLPREQRLGLEEIAGLAVQPGERLAIDADAAGGGDEQAGGGVEERGLAAAGRPDDGDELAIRDGEVGLVHGDEGAVAPVRRGEGHPHPGELDREAARAILRSIVRGAPGGRPGFDHIHHSSRQPLRRGFRSRAN